MTEETVIARREGRLGWLLMNRPRALNALDQAMIEALVAALDGWRDDPAVAAVVLDSTSDRAFCAGGDIRAIRTAALAGDGATIERFFTAEYALNAAIAEYPKPYVALIDGICMGGGIGVSVHGTMRVTTERGLFAMPETAIGMFPDVGATFVLPRLHGALGMFLGLTGTRLAGGDAVHAGLATHFVPAAALPALRAALVEQGAAAVSRHAVPPPPFTLAPHLSMIARCFSAGSVAEILTRLAAEPGEAARDTLATLRGLSPAALCWSHAALTRGAGLDLRTALTKELALTRHVTRHPDFAEGVRAMVVDKDRAPRWTPATVEQVDAGAIAAMLDG